MDGALRVAGTMSRWTARGSTTTPCSLFGAPPLPDPRASTSRAPRPATRTTYASLLSTLRPSVLKHRLGAHCVIVLLLHGAIGFPVHMRMHCSLSCMRWGAALGRRQVRQRRRGRCCAHVPRGAVGRVAVRGGQRRQSWWWKCDHRVWLRRVPGRSPFAISPATGYAGLLNMALCRMGRCWVAVPLLLSIICLGFAKGSIIFLGFVKGSIILGLCRRLHHLSGVL